MAMIEIKGHEFNALVVRDSFGRRAMQYKNNIITVLSKLGLTADDIKIDIEPVAIKNLPASCTWYYEGYRLYYSYKTAKKYVDNLFIVYKVIEFEVADLLSGKKSFEDFLHEFTEKEDVEALRKEAREVLGVSHDIVDMEHIDKKFKDLAKKHHPDMPGGNTEMFKKINDAHKVLKRELK